MDLLEKAFKLEKQAEDIGFCWENPEQILAQIASECEEIKEHLPIGVQNTNKNHNGIDLQMEIGDLLHAVLSLCVFCDYDIKETLNISLNKFAARFLFIKKIARDKGIENFNGLPFSKLMEIWDQAKNILEGISIDAYDEIFALESYPLLDNNKVAELVNLNKEVAKDIFNLMANHDIPKNLDAINAIREQNDWDLVAKIVHKIKGGAMYCGATRLKYICMVFEKHKEASNFVILPLITEQLVQICIETQQALMV